MTTSIPNRARLALLLGLCGLGCRRDEPPTLRDSEGRAFVLRCDDARKRCLLIPAGGEKSQGTYPILHTEGRLVGVCDAVGEEGRAHPADCRPLVCEKDTDCPPIHGPGTGSCIDRLCVDPARPIVTSDAVMLCLSGTGLGHEKPLQIERYALGTNCGSPCVVPSPCRQP